MKKSLYPATVFITGGCVLVIEVVAVRVLAPYFGNTIFSYSSVLTIILLALSVGYYFGGKIADKYRSSAIFFGLITLSGLLVLGFHSLSQVILEPLSEHLSVRTGPLLSASALYLLPALILGTISPYAMTLQSNMIPEKGVGGLAGTMFFFSTTGSILGSLLAGFYLIPLYGINAIFVGTALTLILLGLIPLLFLGTNITKIFMIVSASFVLLVAHTVIGQLSEKDYIYDKQGRYERIRIVDSMQNGRPVRYLITDRSSSSAQYLDTKDPTEMVFDYNKYFLLYKPFLSEPESILIIGGGAYTLPGAYSAKLPDAKIDVVEIEPSLFKLAKEYFRADFNSNMTNIVGDGRRHLNSTTKKYDIIHCDAFLSMYSMPSHLTTKEFLQETYNTLDGDGIYIVNIIGDISETGDSFVRSELHTMSLVYDSLYAFAVDDPQANGPQNIIAVGVKGNQSVDLTKYAKSTKGKDVRHLIDGNLIDIQKLDLSSHVVLTDDYAPVDFLVGKMLR